MSASACVREGACMNMTASGMVLEKGVFLVLMKVLSFWKRRERVSFTRSLCLTWGKNVLFGVI